MDDVQRDATWTTGRRRYGREADGQQGGVAGWVRYTVDWQECEGCAGDGRLS